MDLLEQFAYEIIKSDGEAVVEGFANWLWEKDGGGADFMKMKHNHAVAEGYEIQYYRPFYPQEVIPSGY